MRLDDHRLGETPEPLEVTTTEEAAAVALALARQAARTLDVLSRQMDPRIFDTADFAEAVTRLVLRSRRAQVRILVQDVEPVLRDGHRLVTLSQRLPSFLQIRVPAQEYRTFNQAFIVADGTGYLHRGLADRYEGKASFHAPARARELLRAFQPIWDTAEPDPSFRTLGV